MIDIVTVKTKNASMVWGDSRTDGHDTIVRKMYASATSPSEPAPARTDSQTRVQSAISQLNVVKPANHVIRNVDMHSGTTRSTTVMPDGTVRKNVSIRS